MKVLFIHQFFVAAHEPGEVRHIKLFEHLTGLDDFEFYIVGGSLNYLTGKAFPDFSGLKQKFTFANPKIQGVRVYAAPVYRRGFLGRISCYLSFLVTSILAAFPDQKPDLVLSTSPSLFTALAGYLVSRIKGVPFYFEVRDLWPQAPVEMGMLNNPQLIKFSYWLEKFLAQKAEKVIALTEGYRDYFLKLGIRPDKIAVLPNGVDEEWLDYAPEQTPPEMAELKKQGKFIVMYAGAVGRFNYLDYLLEAALKLKDHPEIQFVLIGDGNYKAQLEEQARSLELNNVSFLGSRPREAVPAYLASADLGVVIYPRIPVAKTLLMNKLLDSLSLGLCPLLVAEEGVSTRILKEGECGIIVPHESGELSRQILEAALSPEKVKTMGRKGREYVRKNFNRRDQAALLGRILRGG